MLVDSHCHVDAGEFDRDRDEVIARARAAGVARQVVPAIHAAGWPKLRDICAGTNGLFPAYGLHPMFLAEHRPEHLSQLRDWIEREHPVAVGECGLDHFVEGLDHDAQQSCFEGQLALAREYDLPVIVHARRAVDARSEEHTSELQSLMRISYAVFCLKKKNVKTTQRNASVVQ